MFNNKTKNYTPSMNSINNSLIYNSKYQNYNNISENISNLNHYRNTNLNYENNRYNSFQNNINTSNLNQNKLPQIIKNCKYSNNFNNKSKIETDRSLKYNHKPNDNCLLFNIYTNNINNESINPISPIFKSNKILEKSQSAIDISNNSILNLIKKNRKKTDITNNEVFDKYKYGENKEYLDYCKKNREYQLYNQFLIEERNKRKKCEQMNDILSEQREINKEKDYYKIHLKEDRNEMINKQQYYKKCLDEQIKNTIKNKLFNENLKYSDLCGNNAYYDQRNKTPIRQFLNKNNYVEVNPFNNNRNYNLGESNLENNTILNSRIQFKINKYMFPKLGGNADNILY